MQRSPAQACMPFYLISIYICIKRITSPSLRAVLFDQYLYLYQKDHLVVVSKGSTSFCIKGSPAQACVQLSLTRIHVCIKRTQSWSLPTTWLSCASRRACVMERNQIQNIYYALLNLRSPVYHVQAGVRNGTQLDPNDSFIYLHLKLTDGHVQAGVRDGTPLDSHRQSIQPIPYVINLFLMYYRGCWHIIGRSYLQHYNI